jgi:hypothetical protein
MNASQIPYDQLDWLQIAIYFLALPIVAFTGALFGLLGRTRRGGLLWATNVGLFGGAVACVIVAFGISTLEGESLTNFLDIFLELLRWKMLVATLAATGCCAIAAGLAWRLLYAPREKQPFAISIRGVLLVQFFALISMGSWIGLRLYMLEASDAERVKLIPEVPGWTVLDGGKRLQISSPYDSTETQIREALAGPIVKEIAALKQLETIELFLDGDWNIDLSPLFGDKSYQLVRVHCVNPNESTLKQLARAKTKQLWLSGDYSTSNLSPLAESKFIQELTVQGRISRRSLETLSGSSTLTAISLVRCELTADKQAVEAWPPQLQSLNISGGPINQHDLAVLSKQPNLKWLYVDHLLEEDEAISAIASMPALEFLNLKIGRLSPSGWLALGGLKTYQVRLHLMHPTLSKSQILPLVQMKGLVYLDLIDAAHGDDVVEAIATNDSLTALSISNPAISEGAMLSLAAHPHLTVVEYPEHLDTLSFHSAFKLLRSKSNLPQIQYLTPIGTVRPQDLPPAVGSGSGLP